MAKAICLHRFVVTNTSVLTILSIVGVILFPLAGDWLDVPTIQLGVLFCVLSTIVNGLMLYGIYKRKTNIFLLWLCCSYLVVGAMTTVLIFRFLEAVSEILNGVVVNGNIIIAKQEEHVPLDLSFGAVYIYCFCSIIAVLFYHNHIVKRNKEAAQTAYSTLE